jgi:hypothetical protein
MPKNIKRGKGGRAKPSLAALSGFASAKASTYDKQERKRKERALNSKVVNKYRKLKARLHATDAAILPSTAGKEQQPAAAAVAQSPGQQSLQPQSQRALQLDQLQRLHDGKPACMVVITQPAQSKADATSLQSAAQPLPQDKGPSTEGNQCHSCSALHRRRRPSG